MLKRQKIGVLLQNKIIQKSLHFTLSHGYQCKQDVWMIIPLTSQAILSKESTFLQTTMKQNRKKKSALLLIRNGKICLHEIKIANGRIGYFFKILTRSSSLTSWAVNDQTLATSLSTAFFAPKQWFRTISPQDIREPINL